MKRNLQKIRNRKRGFLKRKNNVSNVTRFVKIRLIADERNCSYGLFLLANSTFVNFLFSSKNQKYDSSAFIHIAIIAGEG